MVITIWGGELITSLEADVNIDMLNAEIKIKIYRQGNILQRKENCNNRVLVGTKM